MIECYLVDVEGTIVTDKSYTPIEGAIDWLNRLHFSKKNFSLVTNNTTHKPKDLLSLLWKVGFELDEKNLESCLSVALNWLKENRIENCFVIGSNGLKKFLKENGIKLNNEKIQAVLVGLDENLNYNKLKIATSSLIKNDAFLLALHANKIYKDKNGQIAPSVGAVVKALEYSTGKKALILGKPSEIFYLSVLNKLNSLPEKTLMISDDPFSDLVGAKKMGMKTAFVLSGKYKDKDILNEIDKDIYPDFVFDNITAIEICK
jgi:4-nitrophenyl phosphatase